MAMDLERRLYLGGLLGASFWPQAAWSLSPGDLPAQCLAAWDSPDGQHWVGVLLAHADDRLAVVAKQALPTRAHGLYWEADGSVLVVARRPGEWLLRWHPHHSRPLQWQWLSGARVLSGHALVLPGAASIYTIEQDGNTAEGWLVARERGSLREQLAWPTGGLDPHMALADGPEHVLVANGGVPPVAMARQGGLASSLVRLSLKDGTSHGAWRLPDPDLSIRHMARHTSGRVGIALQAEHAVATERLHAPVLALFDGQTLHLADAVPGLGGYGGDIAADAQGFVVSASRAPQPQGGTGALVQFSLDGDCRLVRPWPQAGALGDRWAAGSRWQTPWSKAAGAPLQVKAWDNHLG